MSAVRRVWGVAWRPVAVGAAVGVVMLAVGMMPSSAVVVALAVAAFVFVMTRVDARSEPRPTRSAPPRSDGMRSEVDELAWSMVGRDGRVGGRALNRLREAGARRVARHGLDLADPAHADVVVELVGARAYATLTRRRHPLPSVGDLTHTLGVLERLGATRTRREHGPHPTAVPATDPGTPPPPAAAPGPHPSPATLPGTPPGTPPT